MNLKKIILLVVISLTFLLDYISKKMIIYSLPRGGVLPIIPGYFDLVHTKNRGAAFGVLANLPENIRLPFFLTLSLVALITVVFYFLRQKDSRKTVWVCLGLILGGAFGNLWDRIRAGEVTDFLSFHWQDKRVFNILLDWPAFNVADMAISVAVILLTILMMFPPMNQNNGSS